MTVITFLYARSRLRKPWYHKGKAQPLTKGLVTYLLDPPYLERMQTSPARVARARGPCDDAHGE